MAMKRLFSLLLLMNLLSFALQAQNVTGHWYGVGKVDLPGSSNSYMSEMILTQKGKQVTGLFNYYFRDSLFSNKISGTFDAASRRLVINPTQLIHHSSTSTITGIDCPMSGEFLLRVAKMESVLTGTLVSTKDYRFTCPPVNFKLKIETDTVAKEVTVPEPVKDTIAKAPPKEEEKLTPEEEEKAKEFKKREKTYLRIIEVSNPVLKLEFYDNGAIDYDSISVFMNNRMVLPRTMLSHRAIRFSVTMDWSLDFNELSMFAESIGMIPPNTAAVIIYDGAIRHDVMLTSDFDKTATIKLVRKKE
jgi:hypothetical protein